jgi:trigger factor
VQVTTETVAPREVVLTIVPDPETIDRAKREAARTLSRYRPLRGYRPGRAPYALVERAYGHEAILNEALSKIAQDIYHEAIHEANIQPYQQGTLDIETEDPLVLKVEVPLVPEVKLGAIEELPFEPAPEVAVTDKDVDDQLDILRREHAEVQMVERSARMGDQVMAVVIGKVGEEEVTHQDGATLNLTEYMEPKGFADALLGAIPGDVREFSVTYPADESDRKLAGKQVDYRVAVGEIREMTLPALDDSFAKTVGDFETIDALRERVAHDLADRRKAEAMASERLHAVQGLIGSSSMEYPNAALEREIDRAMSNRRAYAQRLGFGLDNYLRLMNRTEQDLRDEIRDDAREGLLQRLVLLEYARQEGILLTDEEGNAALNDYARHMTIAYDDKAEDMLKQAAESGFVSMVIEDALVMKAAQQLADRLAGRLEAETDAADAANAGGDAGTAGADPAIAEAEGNATPEAGA